MGNFEQVTLNYDLYVNVESFFIFVTAFSKTNDIKRQIDSIFKILLSFESIIKI